MVSVTGSLSDLEQKVSAGQPLTRADAERVLTSVDLISIGMLGQAARQRRTNDDVTFLRVALVSGGVVPDERGDPGEVRITGTPHVIEEAVAQVEKTKVFAAGVPLTGFGVQEILDLAGHDRTALVDVAARLARAGLESIAEFSVDTFDTTEEALEVAQAIERGGLGVWRLTVEHASLADRLKLIDRAAELARTLATVRAFAPLPRRDPVENPSTGYDDVRTMAVARLICDAIGAIQVDWPLYGPKLAQVALAYGADDIDGIAAVDSQVLGARRAPKEDIMRQIRAAGCVPIERNGRGERRP
jgi:2-iminoacetate synthase ThiH